MKKIFILSFLLTIVSCDMKDKNGNAPLIENENGYLVDNPTYSDDKDVDWKIILGDPLDNYSLPAIVKDIKKKMKDSASFEHQSTTYEDLGDGMIRSKIIYKEKTFSPAKKLSSRIYIIDYEGKLIKREL